MDGEFAANRMEVDGKDGENGKDGKDRKDGKDGEDRKDRKHEESEKDEEYEEDEECLKRRRMQSERENRRMRWRKRKGTQRAAEQKAPISGISFEKATNQYTSTSNSPLIECRLRAQDYKPTIDRCRRFPQQTENPLHVHKISRLLSSRKLDFHSIKSIIALIPCLVCLVFSVF